MQHSITSELTMEHCAGFLSKFDNWYTNNYSRYFCIYKLSGVHFSELELLEEFKTRLFIYISALNKAFLKIKNIAIMAKLMPPTPLQIMAKNYLAIFTSLAPLTVSI